MDTSAASFYRAILFSDREDSRPIPATLIQLHMWGAKRWQALGLGTNITKAAAFNIATMWLSGTAEGREFARTETKLGNMFSDPEVSSDASEKTAIDWNTLPAKTKVIATVGDEAAVGEFVDYRSSWVRVSIGGETKSFRSTQVQLAGA